MEEGEELDVVELDQGDGWTRVRRINSDEEGFVPTSYIEVEIAECWYLQLTTWINFGQPFIPDSFGKNNGENNRYIENFKILSDYKPCSINEVNDQSTEDLFYLKMMILPTLFFLCKGDLIKE